MPLVTFRVDDETKGKMDRLERVNWSRVLRAHIQEVLDRESRKNRMEALRIMERISTHSPSGWDSTSFIRRMRESRYGPRGRRR
jgi:Arc/MetJ-type ribon-helix-helix transcriptional regulator